MVSDKNKENPWLAPCAKGETLELDLTLFGS